MNSGPGRGRRRGRQSSPDDPDRVPSWEEVARDYGNFLYTVSFRLTGNRDDVSDLVQEVLLRVRRGLRTYKPGSMEGWLSRIATNAFLDDVRRKKRRPADALPDDAERVLPTSEGADEALDRLGLPEEIQAALAGLADDFRAAVILSDVAGLTYQEIAEALDVPIGTVRSRIHRGRVQLRKALS